MSCTNQAGCGCNTCCPATSLKFFSNRTTTQGATTYLADGGVELTGSATPAGYTPAERFRVQSLAINLGGAVVTGQTLTVSVQKNGVAILSVVYAAGETGRKRATLTTPVSFSPTGNGGGGDELDVVAVEAGGALTAYEISGSIGLLG